MRPPNLHIARGCLLAVVCWCACDDPNPSATETGGSDTGAADRDISNDDRGFDQRDFGSADAPFDIADGGDLDSGVGVEDVGNDDPGFDRGVIPAEGRWTTIETLPGESRRQEHAVVALGREIVVIGGFAGSLQATRSVEGYDPSLDRWRRMTDAPFALHHPNAVALGDDLWIVGHLGPDGFDESGGVYVYSGRDDRWSQGPSMPEGRERGASGVAVVDGLIYVIGGYRDSVAVAEVDRFDPESGEWTALPDLPGGPSEHLATGAIGDTIYVAGGRSSGVITNLAFAFDTETETWSSLLAMPTPRAGVAAAVAGGRLYVFGGEGNRANEAGIFDVVESFDPETGRWTSLAPMPTPRHGLGAATVNGRIYLPLGADREGFSFVSSFEAFDPPR